MHEFHYIQTSSSTLLQSTQSCIGKSVTCYLQNGLFLNLFDHEYTCS